jgi:glycosyltransferase involved in cell wall biosynthesis
MRITVAICTWNRAWSFERTLASLAAARRPGAADLEIIVVNNRCSDETDAVIGRFMPLLPLRRVWQPVPGLSNARNAAIAAATGEYVVWTDDDVVVDPGWLVAYEDAFNTHPEAAFFGGAIEPVFEGGTPEWIRAEWRHLACAFAERELGSEPFEFDAERLPFGANMAVRTTEQRAHLFDPRLGRQPGHGLVGGDEIAIFRAMLARGASGRWLPTCRVRHCIPPERQTLRYVRDYFVGQGRTKALTRPPAVGCRVLGRPAWLWRRAVSLELRFRLLRGFGDREQWLPAMIKAATASGVLEATRL